MSQLLPLLKKCLSCDPVDGPLMVSALTCVKEVLAMEEGKDVTADLIASLYPQWLEIAVASSSAPMSGLATNSNFGYAFLKLLSHDFFLDSNTSSFLLHL